MTSTVVVETPRLILRTAVREDAGHVAESWRLDEGVIPLQEAEAIIHRMNRNHAKNEPGKVVHLCLAIILKETGEWIGWCGLDHTNPADVDPALFYLLKKAFWHQGLATEAAQALLEYAFSQLALPSIHGGAAPENLASKRVMEKIGMRYLGADANGGYAFVLTREEYMMKPG